MIYTSAFYHGTDQTLEQAQENKLNMLCNKVHLKKGDKFLDIGCGWGTLVRHAAQKFGAKARGVTLSKEGAAWCRAQAANEGLSDKCEFLNCDYRDIPADRKFDAISAVEMAEHVGIANFGLFLGNVRSMLADDGLFYMQVAGLRKGSNWQDTQWGLFMSRYIFPGADASTPLFWYVKQLEMAGFEVKSVETVRRGLSLSLTLTLTLTRTRTLTLTLTNPLALTLTLTPPSHTPDPHPHPPPPPPRCAGGPPLLAHAEGLVQELDEEQG